MSEALENVIAEACGVRNILAVRPPPTVHHNMTAQDVRRTSRTGVARLSRSTLPAVLPGSCDSSILLRQIVPARVSSDRIVHVVRCVSCSMSRNVRWAAQPRSHDGKRCGAITVAWHRHHGTSCVATHRFLRGMVAPFTTILGYSVQDECSTGSSQSMCLPNS
jgi:hypothetical protein